MLELKYLNDQYYQTAILFIYAQNANGGMRTIEAEERLDDLRNGVERGAMIPSNKTDTMLTALGCYLYGSNTEYVMAVDYFKKIFKKTCNLK